MDMFPALTIGSAFLAFPVLSMASGIRRLGDDVSAPLSRAKSARRKSRRSSSVTSRTAKIPKRPKGQERGHME